jgi:Fe-S oxidoreductase
VQNDPLTEALSAPGSGGDPAHGLAKAVEMCNNNGHCRKFDAGTMCPSYRVTRDEIHLTRGRANTLRLALSGQVDGDLAGDAVHAALDLCVSCKGCRRECPTGVDMAKFKIEARHRRQAAHGLALRDRVVASLPRWAAWAARMPGLFNLRDRLPGAAQLAERVLGIDARRSLPRWRSDTFLRTAAADDPDPNVVLLADTFTQALEPENAHDALRVLRAAGYRVAVARAPAGEAPLCCGRTWLTAGRLDTARGEARRLLDALAPHVARGAAVVGLEPSCLLSLRDEFLVMGLGERAVALAQRAFLIEEFLDAERRGGRLALPLRALPQSHALVHGHCHQKAFDALKPVRSMLEQIPGLTVDVVDSSCCGMAGAFGYEAEHYDTSLAMAELSLLPAVRAASRDTIIVAGGTSCRHQIADGTRGTEQRTALHPVRVLASAL